MPYGDGTGPQGMGPMTGRGAGYCAGYAVPGYMNPIPVRGFRMGFGRGRGRGWRNWHYATGMPAFGSWVPQYPTPPVWTPSPQDESEMLKNQADFLKKQLDDIQNRISILEKTQKDE